MKKCVLVPVIGKRDSTSLLLEERSVAGEKTECERCCNSKLCNTGTLCGANSKNYFTQFYTIEIS